MMFVDSSAVVAILSREPDAPELARRLEEASPRMTSALVILESAMRLASKLDMEPTVVHAAIELFLGEAEIEVTPIDRNDAGAAVEAFARYGKGCGHPAQLNLADCLSYACAKNRGLALLYEGGDFARTDLG